MCPRPSTRPRVLVATTNFPLVQRGDRTGNFIVDPVVALSDRLDQVVLVPNDAHEGAARERWMGAVPVVRFRYWVPRSAMHLAHGHGIPTNLRESWMARLQLIPLVVVFAAWILRLGRRVDVIHAHWLPVAVLALPARWLFGVPVVVTIHGTDVTQFPSWFVSWGLARVDVVISSHDDLLATVRRLAPTTRTERIRHYVQPHPGLESTAREIRERLGDGPLAVFVARLSSERDPLTFVRAAPHVLRRIPEARFAVVGDGPLMPAVRSEVARLGLEDVVGVFGYRHDVWSFLREGDAFAALSDRNNAWVTAMVEAMRAGLPVVATTAGVTAEALTDGKDALLVDVGDPRAVGDALARLLEDPALRERIVAGAAETLEREGFEPQTILQRTEALYRELARRF